MPWLQVFDTKIEAIQLLTPARFVDAAMDGVTVFKNGIVHNPVKQVHQAVPFELLRFPVLRQ